MTEENSGNLASNNPYAIVRAQQSLCEMQASRAVLISNAWLLIGSSHHMNVASDHQIKKSLELLSLAKGRKRQPADITELG